MVNTKITDATNLDPALTGDEIPINRVSGGPLDGKITAGSLITLANAAFTGGMLDAVQVVTTTGQTYTPPSNLRFVVVEVVGGGGAGAGAGLIGCGSGGGAGGYAKRLISATTLTTATVTITLGTGGAAGATGAAGTAGASTLFGSFLTGCGGAAGVTGATVAAGADGGGSSNGSFGVNGGAGMWGSRFSSSTVANSKVVGGMGGDSVYGGGGRGIVTITGGIANGIAATNYGGGGGGGANYGASGSIGGAGTQGICIIWQYV